MLSHFFGVGLWSPAQTIRAIVAAEFEVDASWRAAPLRRSSFLPSSVHIISLHLLSFQRLRCVVP